jgi:hypothetical protein
MKFLAAVLICVILVPAVALGVVTKTTIYQIQQGMFTVGDSVRVDSVIVTNYDGNPTTYGFHVQEQDGGAWSGILAYCSSHLPAVEIGDLVSVVGYYDEYNNHSEIQLDANGYTVITPSYGVPACELLSCEDLGQRPEADSTWAEKWEGVFVCMDTIVVVDLWAYNEVPCNEAHDHPGMPPALGDSVNLDDKCVGSNNWPTFNVGDTLVIARGTVAEEYGTYKIWLRTAADVVFLHGAPPPSVSSAYPTSNTSIRVIFNSALDELSAEDENNYSLESGVPILNATLDLTDSMTVDLTTGMQASSLRDSITVCDVQSTSGSPMQECQKLGFRAGITLISQIQTPTDTTDASPMDGERVTFTGIIVNADTTYGGPFFMQEKAGGPWNGIYVYTFLGGAYDVGDSVVVSGFVLEYYNWTEISGVDYIENAASGVAFNGPAVVTPDQIKTGSETAESYESVFIKMDSVEVFTYLDGVGEWTCGDNADTVAVGDFTCAYNPCYDYPGLGSWISIQGPMRWNFAEFKIEPRENSDIVVLDPCTAGVKGSDRFPLKLAQNAPNPFTGETVLKFSVPRKMNVKMSIYDISGRLVKTVADGDVDAGEHTVTWDGKDSFRRDVSPGIYFVRMATPERAFQKKMVLLQ